jgi:hypothetical protein
MSGEEGMGFIYQDDGGVRKPNCSGMWVASVTYTLFG